jgi:hypothetical protein
VHVKHDICILPGVVEWPFDWVCLEVGAVVTGVAGPYGSVKATASTTMQEASHATSAAERAPKAASTRPNRLGSVDRDGLTLVSHATDNWAGGLAQAWGDSHNSDQHKDPRALHTVATLKGRQMKLLAWLV